jgi:hypothetical protein
VANFGCSRLKRHGTCLSFLVSQLSSVVGQRFCKPLGTVHVVPNNASTSLFSRVLTKSQSSLVLRYPVSSLRVRCQFRCQSLLQPSAYGTL